MNNFVAMEQAQCPVCGKIHDTGVLISTDLKEIKNTVTHQALCDEHQDLYDNGYISLIEVELGDTKPKSTMVEDDVTRTGNMCYVKRDLLDRMFDIEIKENSTMMYITKETFALIKALKH